MVRLIRTKPEAAVIVATFIRSPDSEVPYCICGPDLDMIEHGKCLKSRCGNSCVPAYREILEGLDVVDSVEIDCQEPAPADAC